MYIKIQVAQKKICNVHENMETSSRKILRHKEKQDFKNHCNSIVAKKKNWLLINY